MIEETNSISNLLTDTMKMDDLIHGELTTADGEKSSSLEILVDLAKQGEIDPWDVDLEEVTEKYMEALDRIPKESLKEAARGIFYASVLLRLKSDVLSSKVNEALNVGLEDDLMDGFFDDELDTIKQITFRDLEGAISRRSMRRVPRHRPITLEDLIDALTGAEQEEKERAERKLQRQLMLENLDYEIVEPEVSDDMLELTHAEDMESCLKRAKAFLTEYLINGEGIHFDELRKYLGCWSNSFLACCFLSHDNDVNLKQDVMYGDLMIYEPES